VEGEWSDFDPTFINTFEKKATSTVTISATSTAPRSTR